MKKKTQRMKELPKELREKDKIFKEGFDMGFEAGVREQKKEILILIKQLERDLKE